MDIFETDDAVIVRLEMAGVRGDDLRVNVDADVLHIRGTRKTPDASGLRRLHQMEIAFGPFETHVPLRLPSIATASARTSRTVCWRCVSRSGSPYGSRSKPNER